MILFSHWFCKLKSATLVCCITSGNVSFRVDLGNSSCSSNEQLWLIMHHDTFPNKSIARVWSIQRLRTRKLRWKYSSKALIDSFSNKISSIFSTVFLQFRLERLWSFCCCCRCCCCCCCCRLLKTLLFPNLDPRSGLLLLLLRGVGGCWVRNGGKSAATFCRSIISPKRAFAETQNCPKVTLLKGLWTEEQFCPIVGQFYWERYCPDGCTIMPIHKLLNTNFGTAIWTISPA